MRNRASVWNGLRAVGLSAVKLTAVAMGLSAMTPGMSAAEPKTVTLRSEERPVDVAVSVIDNKLATAEKENTIITTMLLTGELRGAVEDAAWYFPDSLTQDHRQAMDALMLTQGWSRYDVPATLSGKITETTAPLEIGLTVCGELKGRWGRPLKNGQINVIVPSMRIASIAETDRQGRVCIEGIDVPEGTMMILQALNTEGLNETNLTIYPDSLPAVIPLRPLSDEMGMALDKVKERLGNTILLADIEVTGSRRTMYNGVTSSFSVTASDISSMNASSVEQVLRSMPGISINGDKVDYRGDNVTMLINDQGTVTPLQPDETYSAVDRWTTPQPVQDWVIQRNHATYTSRATGAYMPPPTPGGPTPKRDELTGYVLYSSLPIENVSRIDYYSADAKGAFGVTDIHSGGVIMVRLKQPGQRLLRHDERYKEYMPLGYQRKKQFYTPKYELMAEYELNNRPTLYWIPSAKVDRYGSLTLPIPASVDSYTIVAEGIDENGHPVRITN